MLFAFSNPQLSYGLPPYGRVPSFAIHSPKLLYPLAYHLPIIKVSSANTHYARAVFSIIIDHLDVPASPGESIKLCAREYRDGYTQVT